MDVTDRDAEQYRILHEDFEADDDLEDIPVAQNDSGLGLAMHESKVSNGTSMLRSVDIDCLSDEILLNRD